MEIKFISNSITNIKKIKKARCPTCKKVAVKPFTPFCSKKCSDVDLIKWLSDDKYDSHKNSQ